jgi:hypothetical protein
LLLGVAHHATSEETAVVRFIFEDVLMTGRGTGAMDAPSIQELTIWIDVPRSYE